MEAIKKMKYILEDVFELERKMKEYEDIKIKLKERKYDLDLAIEEYQNTNEIKLYDKVKVVKNYSSEPMDDFEIFENAVGTVIDIDSDYRYPYLIEFRDGDVEGHSRKNGRPLWEREQLELI